ncbi:O-antigen ligase family protein [Streptomyces fulvoviolaceus]|uniref:O-antigen ligase family protein n=1 Tax=Streptomyces fulvoviolaceus TaxID=285535 RepID=UPI0004C5FF9D|nr:O-antigen ligase family protein [Streptomyces fulvoviolaceus]MCT9078919.1 O-antigen ligase family protein [Streptomyces fulvoviolaceus]
MAYLKTDVAGHTDLDDRPSVSQAADGKPTTDNRLIAGTVAVAVLLTGGRWISHLHMGPLYIGDVLLCAAFLQAICLRSLSGQRRERIHGPGILIGLLLLVTGFHLLAVEGDLRMAARDAAPFAYAAIAYLSAGGYQRASDRGRARTVRLIHGGLLLHLSWMVVATLAPDWVATLPRVGPTRVFEIRTDFDVAVLGVLAGMSILRIRRGRIWLHGSVAAAALATGLAQVNRAALISCCLCVLVAVMLRAGRNGRLTLRAVTLGAIAVLAVVVAVLPMSPAGQRLLALNKGATASSELVENAQGTKRARLIAWERVVTYTLDDPARSAIGVGFGPDFLQLSNGDLPIGRGMGVRSPHNYLITSFARLGFAGLTIVVALLASLLAIVIRIVRRGPPDELTSLCVLLVVSLLVVSLLGVILESPFGATPFFWAAGILLAGHRTRRARRRQKPEQKKEAMV